jgi:hypothetical protein
MALQQYLGIFSAEELQTLSNLPEVLIASERLAATSGSFAQAYFTVTLPNSIKQKLQERLGIDLSAVTSVPMRWIKGDMAPHIDRGSSAFENTHLVYITESPGELVVDGVIYPIHQNTAYIFSEGLNHETRATEGVPRLLLGPMNEFAQPVGAPMYYYANQADAEATINDIAYGITYTVGDIFSGNLGGVTSWRIASNSTGSSSQAIVYQNGASLNPSGTYFMYPATPCFLEGSKLLCKEGEEEVWKPIESIQKGDLVKTSHSGFKAVVVIGSGSIANPGTAERTENRLYKCSKEAYPELTEDLYITGCHSILVDELTEKQREETKKHLGQIFVTEKRYRLMACVDERAEPWASEGSYTIWHLALENTDRYMNYGVFANGGLLVETCSINFMENKSNMCLKQ